MRILIADDERISRTILHRALTSWGHDVVVAPDGNEAWRVLESDDAPKLAILDWMMPGLNGVELCRDIRRRTNEPYTYILLLTSKNGKSDVIDGLESGADDYLTKPFNPQELKVRLRTGERIIDLLEQLVATREVVREMALHDGLTGLWNRNGILEKLDHELVRADRQESSLSLVLVDLDHFKSINDTFGHAVGDDALRAAAEAIEGTIRPYDYAGRYGGDELLIVLPGCDELNAASHAERVRCALQAISLPTPCGELRLTASLGVAVTQLGASTSAKQLMASADASLYRAKVAGRNRVACAAPVEFLATIDFSAIPKHLLPGLTPSLRNLTSCES